jgi:hypothetical protein
MTIKADYPDQEPGGKGAPKGKPATKGMNSGTKKNPPIPAVKKKGR